MVVVQTERFDTAALIDQLQKRAAGQAGAYVYFLGTVRDYSPDSPSESLFLEHYPGMCEREVQALCERAQARWDILDTHVVHRVGELPVGDPIVFVGVSSTHRSEAFRACEYIIDTLKTRAPFWKRETLASGRAFWVQQQEADALKTESWDHPPAQTHES
ncbi:molybdenum cofactor biosynthesis protein MoaE [Castellaniella sp.]|uniref:molybdenum cofactor biosynthesis protein MoaE n=1 Tax=Castellaniella sp. TaxID=1955812 RepID=UPI003A8F30DD